MTWTDRRELVKASLPEILVIGFLVALVVTILLFTLLKDRREVIFGGMLVNTDVNQEGYDYLTSGVLDLFDGDGKKQKAELSNTVVTETTEFSLINGAYNAAMKPVAKVEEGTLDYLVMNENAMMLYMTQYILTDLTQVFSEEELAAFGDRVVYLELEKEAVRYPVAIRVDAVPFIGQCLNTAEPLYLSFTGSGERAELYRRFWNYLLDWKQTE